MAAIAIWHGKNIYKWSRRIKGRLRTVYTLEGSGQEFTSLTNLKTHYRSRFEKSKTKK